MEGCGNHVVRGTRLHHGMVECFDHRFELLGLQFDYECEQISGGGVERPEDQVETVAVELPVEFQPAFTFYVLSRGPDVGGERTSRDGWHQAHCCGCRASPGR